jgi:hypothetical protein
MKKIIYTLSFLIIGFGAISQTVTELVVPQYMASKSAASANNSRMYYAVCFRIDGLTASTTYAIRVSAALTSEASTTFGAGNIWGGTSFGSANPTFTTDGTGSTGPIWFYLQPTGNASRFGGGAIHNLRIGWAVSPTAVSATPSYVSTNSITALDVASTALTVASTDDGAFLQGNAVSYASGKIILTYDNTAGTGNPISTSRVRNNMLLQASQTDLPTAIDNILLSSATSAVGDYAVVIPIGANNANGIRRIEIRDTLNNLLAAETDADGIWPSGANTTTAAKRAIINITNTDAPLPVTWKSFTATKNYNAVLLTWSTSSETNNNSFEVQRSMDGKKFEAIGNVKGNGTTQKVSSYSFTDTKVASSKTVFYRLKQVDFDGKAEFSKTVSVTHEEIQMGLGASLPNPFNNELTLTLNATNTNSTATIVIMDMIGKTHYTTTEQLLTGANTITINTTNMPDGIYFIRASYNGQTFTQKIVKK